MSSIHHRGETQVYVCLGIINTNPQKAEQTLVAYTSDLDIRENFLFVHSTRKHIARGVENFTTAGVG